MDVPLQLYTNENNVIERLIGNSSEVAQTKLEDIDYVYEIDKCIKWIKANNFEKVCLQFPDFLLGDSTVVAECLQSILNKTVYVMGDTAYESCCVDYVAAAHVNADAIIHYGPKCFSKQAKVIPCLSINEKKYLDINLFGETYFKSFLENNEDVVIFLDLPYIIYLDKVKELFQEHNGVRVYSIDIDGLTSLSFCNVIFITTNQRKLVNFSLSFKPKKLYYYDPKSDLIIDYEQDLRILKRRYFLREKIKDSNTFGIVIGTLAVKNYLRIINRIKKIIEASGKKYYMISVGKPTVAKLANFLELDVYVLITCALNEIYESSDYYKPIVTPYDVELALNPDASNLNFSYDYNFYIPDEDISEKDLENIKNLEINDVSLITGNVRSINTKEITKNDVSTNCKDVAVAAENAVALSSNFGAGFLQERSWVGLEQNLGNEAPELVTEGQRGIAQGYQNET